jgi:hypothetical protein
LKFIAELYPGNLTGDDITVLLFRPNGIGVNSTFMTRLLSPFRLARALLASLLPGGGPAPWPDHHPANVGGTFFSPLNRLWRRRRDEE